MGGLIFLQDAESGQPFLVDTGAAVSVLPHRSTAPPTGPPLTGADGNVISSWGKVTKKLVFGMRTFLCSFILAAVSKPILGIDFLAAHRLLVDPSSRSVLCAETLRPLGALCSAVPVCSFGESYSPSYQKSNFFVSRHCWNKRGHSAAAAWRAASCGDEGAAGFCQGKAARP